MRNPFATAVVRMRASERKSVTTAQLLPAHMNHQPQWSEWDTARAIREGFKASAIVYMCVDKLMKAIASLPWSAFTKQGKEWEPDEESPITQLLEHPNPFMGRQQVMERLTSHLYLGGNAMLSHIIVRGVPVELWPVDVAKVRYVPSRTEFIERYDYDRDGEPVPIKPEEVTHVMFTDPANPYWGMSPLQAAARVVDTDNEAVRWNKVAMQNRAVPDGVFAFKQMVTRDQWEEARILVKEQYEEKARAPWVMGGGAEFHQMGLTPVEMDFIESRKLSREEIAAVYGVPLPLLGFYENATLANIETARKIFWGDTVKPVVEGIANALTRSIVPRFGADLSTTMIAADFSEVEALREDFAAKIATAVQMRNMGIPLNTIIQRLELDIDPVPGGDVPLVPATMIPMDMAGQPSGDPQQTPKGEM